MHQLQLATMDPLTVNVVNRSDALLRPEPSVDGEPSSTTWLFACLVLSCILLAVSAGSPPLSESIVRVVDWIFSGPSRAVQLPGPKGVPLLGNLHQVSVTVPLLCIGLLNIDAMTS